MQNTDLLQIRTQPVVLAMKMFQGCPPQDSWQQAVCRCLIHELNGLSLVLPEVRILLCVFLSGVNANQWRSEAISRQQGKPLLPPEGCFFLLHFCGCSPMAHPCHVFLPVFLAESASLDPSSFLQEFSLPDAAPKERLPTWKFEEAYASGVNSLLGLTLFTLLTYLSVTSSWTAGRGRDCFCSCASSSLQWQTQHLQIPGLPLPLRISLVPRPTPRPWVYRATIDI